MTSDSRVETCLAQCQEGFNQEIEPTLTADGTSGAYVIKNCDGCVAVFKPIDEEPFAPYNPRGMTGPFGSDTCRAGVKSGESTLREVAAYLLDHQGFSGVPATSLVELRHECLPAFTITEDQVVAGGDNLEMIRSLLNIKRSKKVFCGKEITDISEVSERSEYSVSTVNSDYSSVEQTTPGKIGSLQSFVKSEGPIENFSSDLFCKNEIHKIAVLDLRILNLDRNTDNILVQRQGDQYRLVPIDHGLSIPDSLEVCSYDLAWLGYEQSEMPFSQETIDYIESLDIEEDIRTLESTFKMRPVCLRNMKVSSLLLKRGAARGLTLAQIGQVLCRPDDDDSEPSTLEKIVKKAEGAKPEPTQNFGGMRKVSSYNSMADLVPKQGNMKCLLGNALSDQNTTSGQLRARIMTEDVNLDNQSDFQLQDDTMDSSLDLESVRSFRSRFSSVAEETKEEVSFAATCKQQAKQIWSRFNLTKEEKTQPRALNQKGGPHDVEFFEKFSVYLEEAISELLTASE